jgi:hypothetical protein
MALVVKDRVQETSTTTGTGSLTLLGAVTGFQTFSSAIGNTNTTYYTIQNGAEWEVGIGTVSAGSLSRDTVLESSNSGSLVNFSAGSKFVFCTYPAEKSVYYDASNNVNIDITGNAATVTNGLYTSDIGSTVQAYDADTTKNDVANTFIANQVISVTDNTNAALRITQLGTGNALVIEDSTNPDSTPFVVDANGNTGIGVSLPSEKLHVNGNIALNGSTSGTATFSVPAAAGTTTLTLPTTSGTLLTNNSTGYRFVEKVYFTSSGTFSKASYPYLRAMRVMCVGAGGGSGGVAATGAGEFVASGGGAGGGYGESFITDISGLASSVTVTVGSGGAAGAAGANNGSIGGNSSFGSAVIGNGGNGGAGANSYSFWITSGGGSGGGGTGNLVITGGAGGVSNPVNSNGGYGGIGGTSVLGQASLQVSAWQSSAAGRNGQVYGGGASGAASGQSSTAKAGGSGAAGIVILELFA